MPDTKEAILLAALRLFAQNGYEAVSTRDIAMRLGITKSALYKHYRNKRDIFDSIVRRMEETDLAQAKAYAVPEIALCNMAEAYRDTPLEQIRAYSIEQFARWTENAFDSAFRKMLTLEQYRSSEMAALYHQYLGSGPVAYMTDLFAGLKGTRSATAADPRQFAVEFYAPIYLLMSLYDASEDKAAVTKQATAHINRCIDRFLAE